MCSDIFQSPSLFPYRVWSTSSFRSAVGSFLANPFRHCAGPGLRWLSLDWRWLLNRSHKSRNDCEFSRLLFHCCFSAKLRRRSAHHETSDAGHESERFSERAVYLENNRRRCSNDDLVLSHTRIAAAIRPKLSLSVPGFERDLHHADGGDRAKRKTKPATGGW